MKNAANHWLIFFLIVGFINCVLADDVQDQILHLKDQDPLVRRNAATALGNLGYHPKTDVDKVVYLIAQEKWDEATKLGKSAVDPLIACLKSQNWNQSRNQQADIAAALGKLADARAVEPLIACLKDHRAESFQDDFFRQVQVGCIRQNASAASMRAR